MPPSGRDWQSKERWPVRTSFLQRKRSSGSFGGRHNCSARRNDDLAFRCSCRIPDNGDIEADAKYCKICSISLALQKPHCAMPLMQL